MSNKSDNSILICVACIVAAIIVLAIIFKKPTNPTNQKEWYGDAMGHEFIPFDAEGQREMCKIILADPDMKGSGLTEDNCVRMPLTAFNTAMKRTYVCKKNMCGVVGSPDPNTKDCVKGCKQAAYASSIYSSYGYNRPYQTD